MKKKLEQQDRRKKHRIQVLNVLVLFYDVMCDIIGRMVEQDTPHNNVEKVCAGIKQYKAMLSHVQKRMATIKRMTHYNTPEVFDFSLLRHQNAW
jgi:hypothetical protein